MKYDTSLDQKSEDQGPSLGCATNFHYDSEHAVLSVFTLISSFV